MRYRDAGVDVGRADALKRDIARDVQSTWTTAVRRLEGGFAGVIDWPEGRGRLLAATMDGVGTKLHLALEAGRVADAAADLVYHGANDLLVHGAWPLAFLDYVAQSRLDPGVVRDVVAGLARACRETGAALLGGETAEMPDTYLPGVVDVAGCMLGTVDAAQLLDGSKVRAGDVVLALGSSGLHTNGYSLARRVLASSGRALGDPAPFDVGTEGDGTLADALLQPHRWYGPSLEPELGGDRVHALAHVTGGGIAGNLIRVLPEGRRAEVTAPAPRPPLFRWLCEVGAIPEADAREALNLGAGMLVIAAREHADALAADLARRGESVLRLGAVRDGAREVVWMD